MKKPVVLLMMIMLIAAPICSAGGTRIKASKEPGFPDRVISKVLVQADSKDLNHRDIIEKILVEKLRSKKVKVNALSYIEIFSPTREYIPDDIQQTITQNECDSILKVTVTKYFEGSAPTRSHGVTSHRGVPPFLICDLKLIDHATGVTIWTATTDTNASLFRMHFENLVKSMADETVKVLMKDKLILKK